MTKKVYLTRSIFLIIILMIFFLRPSITFNLKHAHAADDGTIANLMANSCRDQYDIWSNQFTCTGTLIKVSKCPYNDPIGNQPNPYCQCPAPTSEGNYYVQGNDKNTGAPVCSFSYYHACPYADGQPLDGAVCQKLITKNNQQPVTKANECDGK